MASLTLRATKGSELTHEELDGNFTSLNTELGNKVATVSGTSGRISVSGTTTSTIDLASIGSTASATLASITIDAYGRVTALSSGTAYSDADARAALSGGTGISYTSGTGAIALASGVASPGSYVGSVTVDTYGRVTAGSNDITGRTEPIYNIGTSGGTIAPNAANGAVQKITLNSALTINGFTSPVAGQSITLFIYGGTAYTAITSTMKFVGGLKTLTGTAGCIDTLTIYYDGSTYFAALGKGYA